MTRRVEGGEDLLTEATALVERIKLRLSGSPDAIVAGFRRDCSLSMFFGTEPVYQFNSAGELRRAFDHGKPYKAQDRSLLCIDRQHKPGKVELVSRPLAEGQLCEFSRKMLAHLSELETALREGSFEIEGQVPSDADIVARLREWLDMHGHDFRPARTPHAK